MTKNITLDPGLNVINPFKLLPAPKKMLVFDKYFQNNQIYVSRLELTWVEYLMDKLRV
jgi:hypothetical protein